MVTQRPQAGIIGAGIAGLASAIALRRAGWDVEVFERSEFKHEIGAAITVSSNATRALNRWGFDFEKTRPVPHQRLTLHTASDLETVMDDELIDTLGQFGAETWAFHRVDLHKGLFELAIAQETEETGLPAKLRLGAKVVNVDCDNGRIELIDGVKTKKDLLVVADGAHSNTVDSVTGKSETLKLTGRSTFRCLIPWEKVCDDEEIKALLYNPLTGMSAISDQSTDTLGIIYMCRGGSIVNIAFVHDTKPDMKITDAWNSPVSTDEILELAQNFHPTFKRLIRLADDPKVYHLMYRDPLESFIRGKTVVLGDAAHPMLPTLASGGAVSIESAASLELLFNLQDQSSASSNTQPQHYTIPETIPLPDLSPSSSNSSGVSESSSPSDGLFDPLSASSSRTSQDLGELPTLPSSKPTQNSPTSQSLLPSSSSLPSPQQLESFVTARLQLYNKLRLPRCNMVQIFSNAGFMKHSDPAVLAIIRKFYDGPVPPPDAFPWNHAWREILFSYDVYLECEKLLREDAADRKQQQQQERNDKSKRQEVAKELAAALATTADDDDDDDDEHEEQGTTVPAVPAVPAAATAEDPSPEENGLETWFSWGMEAEKMAKTTSQEQRQRDQEERDHKKAEQKGVEAWLDWGHEAEKMLKTPNAGEGAWLDWGVDADRMMMAVTK